MIPDQVLVARLRAGDEAAFTWLLDRYHGPLMRLARTFVASAAVAEEVVQETWLGLLKGLDGFEQRATLKTWLFRVLVNRAKTRGVREARSVPWSALGPEDEGEPAVDPTRFNARGRWTSPPQPWEDDTPEALLLRRETRAQLEAAIEALPPRQRTVLVLRDIEGVAPDEVCGMLGLSDANQRVLLHRARAALQRALERHRAEEDERC